MKVVVRWTLIVMYTTGLAVGLQVGYEQGFEAGVVEERIMSAERGECACLDDCCEHHHQGVRR